MGSCLKCGAVLVTQARFCAACGAPVGGLARSRPLVAAASTSAADPFAKTLLGEEQSASADAPQPAAPAQEPPVVSPKAASVWRDPPPPMPGSPAKAQPSPAVPRPVAQPPRPARPVPSQHPPAQPQAIAPARQPAPPAQPPAAPPARPPPALVPGGTVRVRWADGNQYTGTVLTVSPYHVLVAFPNGLQHWIEMRYVTPAR